MTPAMQKRRDELADDHCLKTNCPELGFGGAICSKGRDFRAGFDACLSELSRDEEPINSLELMQTADKSYESLPDFELVHHTERTPQTLWCNGFCAGYRQKAQQDQAKLAACRLKHKEEYEVYVQQYQDVLNNLRTEIQTKDAEITKLKIQSDMHDEQLNAQEIALTSDINEKLDAKDAELEKLRGEVNQVNWDAMKTKLSLQRDRIASLESALNSYKVYGTDGCRKCETGRITLFYHTEKCIRCAPEDYELKAQDGRG
jgi:hypothetical protein